jgi:teichuronic acid exporter
LSLGDKIFSGAFWSLVERISTQAVQAALGIVLARLLTPNDYGLIGLLLVFIVISQVFIDSGFTKALVQKKSRTAEDISTVFFFNIAISIVCYVVLWFCSPLVAVFYEIPKLESLLRVLALSLIINALFTVRSTIVTIALDFKLLAKINLIATIISGGIAIYLAYIGFGVWALVYQTLIKSMTSAILFWSFTKWTPSFKFSTSSFKEMFSFGSNLLIGSLLNTAVNNISSLIIGKLINAKQLGYYTQGVQYVGIVDKTINTVINKVLLPTLSSIQDQQSLLVKYTKNILKTSSILVTPLFFILFVLAEPFVNVLLGSKWMPAAPIIQLFALARLITVFSGINVNLLYVLGRSDLALKQQYVKMAIRVVLILIGVQFGIFYVALAELVSTIIHFFINTYYPGKIMNYGSTKQIKDLSKILALNILTLSLCFLLKYFIHNEVVELIIIPIAYCSLYILANYYLKNPEFMSFLTKIKKMFFQNKK